MFDIGFWELILVGLVALLVFGPERLPRVAKEAALWIRKGRSMVASVKSEIDHELQLQELQQTLREQKKKIELEGRSYVEGVVIPRSKEPTKLASVEKSAGDAGIPEEQGHERE